MYKYFMDGSRITYDNLRLLYTFAILYSTAVPDREIIHVSVGVQLI